MSEEDFYEPVVEFLETRNFNYSSFLCCDDYAIFPRHMKLIRYLYHGVCGNSLESWDLSKGLERMEDTVLVEMEEKNSNRMVLGGVKWDENRLTYILAYDIRGRRPNQFAKIEFVCLDIRNGSESFRFCLSGFEFDVEKIRRSFEMGIYRVGDDSVVLFSSLKHSTYVIVSLSNGKVVKGDVEGVKHLLAVPSKVHNGCVYFITSSTSASIIKYNLFEKKVVGTIVNKFRKSSAEDSIIKTYHKSSSDQKIIEYYLCVQTNGVFYTIHVVETIEPFNEVIQYKIQEGYYISNWCVVDDYLICVNGEFMSDLDLQIFLFRTDAKCDSLSLHEIYEEQIVVEYEKTEYDDDDDEDEEICVKIERLYFSKTNIRGEINGFVDVSDILIHLKIRELEFLNYYDNLDSEADEKERIDYLVQYMETLEEKIEFVFNVSQVNMYLSKILILS